MTERGWRLDTPVEVLNGVGPALSRGLHRLGIATIGDLLNHYPRRWEDYSATKKIAALKPGLVTLKAEVLGVQARRSFKRKLTVSEAILGDDSGTVRAVWFNQPYIATQLKEGQSYFFSGKFEFKNNHLSIQNPSFEPADDQSSVSSKILPIYPENAQINSRLLRKLIAQVIRLTDRLKDGLPDHIAREQGYESHARAIAQLHQPSSMRELELAQDRLAFSELFMLSVSGLALRRELEAETSVAIPFKLETVNAFLDQLSFHLTSAQKRAAWTVFKDIERTSPMNRLIEGDVGSGKTMVAVLAAAMAAQAGVQTAIMVPTEILARQHFKSIERYLRPLGVKVDLLVGALARKERVAAQQRLAAGETQVVIGTQALIGDTTQFHRLGLVVVDEQHRFGVAQRRALRAKADIMPHLLSMTATPIPRSLALVIYGDLDVSIINELPPGRQPIQTKLVDPSHRAKVYGEIDKQITQGRQVYVVCPAISASDHSGRKSVEIEYDKLRKGQFVHRRIGMLHGRMKAEEKESVMADFASGKLDMLIATSVIEVGVDVPNATVMMIEGADRFGLAALHQLRGRVGRGEHQSFCYLVSESEHDEALNRLRSLERTNDGFRLAQIDLELRGPGEVYGVKQHGLDLRLSGIVDPELIKRARAAAESFLATEKVVEYPLIAARVEELKSVTSLD
ncbi:ATP-dependent DNA helicase RecG [bacterium]|nr:ATP-dependent DNA helicase RecG [bacterium]